MITNKLVSVFNLGICSSVCY